MKQFPAAWLIRLKEMAKGLRRREGWGDVFATVEPPVQAEHPPVLRLEKGGAFITEPLDRRAIEQMMRTGQEGPVLMAMRQAFFRLVKLAARREGRQERTRGRGRV